MAFTVTALDKGSSIAAVPEFSTNPFDALRGSLHLLFVACFKSGAAAPVPTVRSHGTDWIHLKRQDGQGTLGSSFLRADLFAVRGISGTAAAVIDYGTTLTGHEVQHLLSRWDGTLGDVDEAVRQVEGSTDQNSAPGDPRTFVWLRAFGDPLNPGVIWKAWNQGASSPTPVHGGYVLIDDFITGNNNIANAWTPGGGSPSPPTYSPPQPGDRILSWPSAHNNARANIGIELGGGRLPWLRQRQRDDAVRAWRGGPGMPRSEQFGLRRSRSNRYQ